MSPLFGALSKLSGWGDVIGRWRSAGGVYLHEILLGQRRGRAVLDDDPLAIRRARTEHLTSSGRIAENDDLVAALGVRLHQTDQRRHVAAVVEEQVVDAGVLDHARDACHVGVIDVLRRHDHHLHAELVALDLENAVVGQAIGLVFDNERVLHALEFGDHNLVVAISDDVEGDSMKLLIVEAGDLADHHDVEQALDVDRGDLDAFCKILQRRRVSHDGEVTRVHIIRAERFQPDLAEIERRVIVLRDTVVESADFDQALAIVGTELDLQGLEHARRNAQHRDQLQEVRAEQVHEYLRIDMCETWD